MLSATETTSCSKKQLFQNRIENEVVDGRETNGKGGESTQVGKNVMETKSGDSIPQASSTAKVSHPVPLKNYECLISRTTLISAAPSATPFLINMPRFSPSIIRDQTKPWSTNIGML